MEIVINELKRLASVFGKDGVTAKRFNEYSRVGSVYKVEQATGLRFRVLKGMAGLKTRKKVGDEEIKPVKTQDGNIFCKAMNEIIKEQLCVPNCRPTCEGCLCVQKNNPGSINNLTQEEDRDMIHDSRTHPLSDSGLPSF